MKTDQLKPVRYRPLLAIDKLPADKRKEVIHGIMVQQKSMNQIAKQFGVRPEDVSDYIDRECKPAMVASLQRDPLTARYCLQFLWDELRDSIDGLKRGRIVMVPNADGTETEMNLKDNYRVTGTVSTLLSTGAVIARAMGEVTGEIGGVKLTDPEDNAAIQGILIPKSLPVAQPAIEAASED